MAKKRKYTRRIPKIRPSATETRILGNKVKDCTADAMFAGQDQPIIIPDYIKDMTRAQLEEHAVKIQRYYDQKREELRERELSNGKTYSELRRERALVDALIAPHRSA